MAIAQQGPLRSPVFELLQAQEMQASGGQALARIAQLPKRCWWHLKAYVPILGILVLVVASLVFLQLHWLSQLGRHRTLAQ